MNHRHYSSEKMSNKISVKGRSVYEGVKLWNICKLEISKHCSYIPWMGDMWNTLTVLVFLNNTIIHIHTVIISNLFPGWYIFWNKEAEYGCKPCPCQQSISLHNKRVIFCLIERWKSDTLVYCKEKYKRN